MPFVIFCPFLRLALPTAPPRLIDCFSQMSRPLIGLAGYLAAAILSSAHPMRVYIGTYTDSTSRGIYVLNFDPADGSISAATLAAEADNPTFLAFDPAQTHLYATGTIRTTPASPKPLGGISAFAVDPASGQLTLVNAQPTGGGATTHVAVDATGRMVVAANYGDGYVCALPLAADGSLGARSAYLLDTGRAPLGPNSARQDQAHAHSVTISPNNRFVYACDLGLDRVFIYRLDPATAGLNPNYPSYAVVPPGSGPRHSKFSADGRFYYVANEMGGTVCVYGSDPEQGGLKLLQTAPTLPADFTALNTVAEVRVSPDQKHVYVSNRGHDSIAVFARDPEQGTLTRIEIVPCGGKHPRNFALSPDGRWLLCANRDTDNVVVFRVDPASGRLTLTGAQAKVGHPVCVLFGR
jgi:6-phosphogluconolactonase